MATHVADIGRKTITGEGVYTSRDATITASTEYAFGGRRVVLTTQENGQELISQIRLSKREAIDLRNVLDAAIERASANAGHDRRGEVTA